jgi:bacterioferritin (cytochrome b1)
MPHSRVDVIDELNRLMAEETEASLRYFQMRFRLRGPNAAKAMKFFEEALMETLEHANAIAHQIRQLGHVPTLRVQLTLDGGPVRPDEALAEALDVEQQALDAYKDFLPRVTGDPNLEAFIRRQIAVETEHVDEIRRTLQGKRKFRVID